MTLGSVHVYCRLGQSLGLWHLVVYMYTVGGVIIVKESELQIGLKTHNKL